MDIHRPAKAAIDLVIEQAEGLTDGLIWT